MKILITGNMGYLGPVVVRHLRTAMPDAWIAGFDAGYFAHCTHGPVRFPETLVEVQHFGDVRDFPQEILDGIDAVVHLAAVSNDPMGSRFEAVTDAINFRSSASVAEKAARRGVKSFVFASSCSMYGAAEGGPRSETDALNPLTPYARSKVATEKELAKLAGTGMVTTALRFSTACGFSERMRLDLVLNDFVAAAIANKEITVLSDGTPWRPLIDVKDMARAIEWALSRPAANGGRFLAVNVGAKEWNYQVRQLAEAVAAEIPGTKVAVNEDAPPDKRSYQVDFSLYERLAPRHQPRVTLRQAVREIKEGLESMQFSDSNFRSSQFMRLKVLEDHIARQRLTEQLRWK